MKAVLENKNNTTNQPKTKKKTNPKQNKKGRSGIFGGNVIWNVIYCSELL